jgi:hypothetical protein
VVGEQLDLSSDDGSEGTPASSGKESRPFLGVRFVCCSVYSRVYRNLQRTAYEGFCPRCGKPIRVRIGEGGTGNRFFDAG